MQLLNVRKERRIMKLLPLWICYDLEIKLMERRKSFDLLSFTFAWYESDSVWAFCFVVFASCSDRLSCRDYENRIRAWGCWKVLWKVWKFYEEHVWMFIILLRLFMIFVVLILNLGKRKEIRVCWLRLSIGDSVVSRCSFFSPLFCVLQVWFYLCKNSGTDTRSLFLLPKLLIFGSAPTNPSISLAL